MLSGSCWGRGGHVRLYWGLMFIVLGLAACGPQKSLILMIYLLFLPLFKLKSRKRHNVAARPVVRAKAGIAKLAPVN